MLRNSIRMVGGKMSELARDNPTEKIGLMLSPAQPIPSSPGTFSAATSLLLGQRRKAGGFM